MSLGDKIVIVTGAACGIGLATARLFAAKGAHVVIAEPPVRKCCRQNSAASISSAGVRAIAGVICNWKGAVSVLICHLSMLCPRSFCAMRLALPIVR
ncbi:SDR family NAD(P)-dependent oxidoreductase [Bradyrhizobium sp. AUGA SZCCT0176]|nr:SDR family NAD(P)-dependent oxidoreductase [Bradyrhizobium sp. AUGA SZCCT0176]MBR1281576.1 SDR family NAD(P)-dependent oxidoreductase [Bradyrhizobium sp. AUGA SZCCT0177]